jgi:hypothetical protein
MENRPDRVVNYLAAGLGFVSVFSLFLNWFRVTQISARDGYDVTAQAAGMLHYANTFRFNGFLNYVITANANSYLVPDLDPMHTGMALTHIWTIRFVVWLVFFVALLQAYATVRLVLNRKSTEDDMLKRRAAYGILYGTSIAAVGLAVVMMVFTLLLNVQLTLEQAILEVTETPVRFGVPVYVYLVANAVNAGVAFWAKRILWKSKGYQLL